MAVLVSTIYEEICKPLRLRKTFTATSAGDSGGSTVVCTSLQDYPENYFFGKWLKITSGDCDEEVRVIERNVDSTIKVKWVFTHQIASAVTFEIIDLNPDDILEAILATIRDSNPEISKFYNDTTLIGGNLVLNGNFEHWATSSSLLFWTAVTSVVSGETTIKRFGKYSLKVVGAGQVYLPSTAHSPLLTLAGSSASFSSLIYCSTASAARLGIYYLSGGSATTEYSDYHTGGSSWEKITATVTIPADITDIRLIIAITGANTAYFDQAYCAGKVYDYLTPPGVERVASVIQGNSMDYQYDEPGSAIDFESFTKPTSVGDKKFLRVPNAITGYKLEVRGHGKFLTTADASPSALTDSLDIDEQWTRILITGGIFNLLQKYGGMINSLQKAGVDTSLKQWEAKYETLKRGHSLAEGIVIPNRSLFYD